jgi:hypothetical protein
MANGGRKREIERESGFKAIFAVRALYNEIFAVAERFNLMF